MRSSSCGPVLFASSMNLPAPEKTVSTFAAAAFFGARAVVRLPLLRQLQPREMLAGHVDLHLASDLHGARVLLDHLHVPLHQGADIEVPRVVRSVETQTLTQL